MATWGVRMRGARAGEAAQAQGQGQRVAAWVPGEGGRKRELESFTVFPLIL
jgi:hypothetical protein